MKIKEIHSLPIINKIKETAKSLYPFEKIVIIYALFTLVFLKTYHFRINYLISYFFYQILSATAIGHLLVFAYFIFLFAQTKKLDKSINSIKNNYLNFNFIVYYLRVIVTISVTMILFCNLKQAIPLVNQKIFDGTFWQLDILLHLKQSPTLLALKIPKEYKLWPFMDISYVSFFMMNILIPWVFTLQKKSERLRDKFITAFCLIWILGGLSYFLFPAMGPCYFKPNLFQGLNIPIAKNLQNFLLIEYIRFVRNPLGYQAKTFYGIAAMPALHVAVPFLFSIFSLKLNPILFVFLSIYAILMLIGSVMLGWHYVIDGYAAILLAFLVYFISRYLVPKEK